jgi:hypothetical protein
MKFKFLNSVLVASSLCISSIAHAGLIDYTDKGTFDSAAGATVLETFNSGNCCGSYTTIDSSTVAGIQTGITFSLLTPFTGTNPLIFNGGGGFQFGSWLHSHSNNGTSALLIEFASNTNAFGFDTNYYMGSGFTVNANNVDGSISTANYSGLSRTPQFFGYTSNKYFNSIEIQGNGNGGVGFYNFAIDNFQFGGAAQTEVPEPSTLAIFALGLMGLASRRFKK